MRFPTPLFGFNKDAFEKKILQNFYGVDADGDALIENAESVFSQNGVTMDFVADHATELLMDLQEIIDNVPERHRKGFLEDHILGNGVFINHYLKQYIDIQNMLRQFKEWVPAQDRAAFDETLNDYVFAYPLELETKQTIAPVSVSFFKTARVSKAEPYAVRVIAHDKLPADGCVCDFEMDEITAIVTPKGRNDLVDVFANLAAGGFQQGEQAPPMWVRQAARLELNKL
ncbi:MAG: hypothetical protein GC136_09375 [Alphaproteobacteria bacterium]|nr:hypothetical protein [Alphaproteobacteria bacterium]